MVTVIKNGTVVTADLSYQADVLIDAGKIIEIGMNLSGDKELDATGCYVMPGGIDPHTHLEMPFMGTYSSDDFESGTPSDRLIVGDVAFGKTEVIIRALFLAAKSNVQSIVFVPTTLLSRQHYNNFLKRFSLFNINIAEVSRLVSPKEKKQIFMNGKFQTRTMLPISLSYDHRIIDGAEAARFNNDLKENLGKNFAYKLAV